MENTINLTEEKMQNAIITMEERFLNVRAVIKKDSYPVPALFDLIQKNGNIEEHMMYNTFNMGIGFVLCVDEKDVDAVIKESRILRGMASGAGNRRSTVRRMHKCDRAMEYPIWKE